MYKFAVAIILSLACTVMVWSIPPGISPGVAAADFVDAFMQREYFINQHKQEIDSLRALPRTAINEYNLARVWARIQADSAVKHMRIANDLATEINDFSLHIKAGSAICSMLPHIDAEGEALHHFQILDTVGASPEARLHYHVAGQEIWFTLAHTTALDTIRHLKVIGSIIAAIAILLVVMLIYICVRLRKVIYDNTALAKLNDKLRRDDIATRQTYINRFIRLCDSFMGSSEEFLKSARRKLSAGQVNDLKLLLKGSELADEQHRMFYATFDSAFLHTFPNFVQEVNSLLMEDKQIEPQPSNTLSTELRIAAFARLGVEDSTKVARFLGLSLTTVYTYRNKLRSKALNRATFFDDLKLPISVNPPTSNQP